VSLRSGEGVLLVVELFACRSFVKVCSIAERGAGGSRTSSCELARGVDDGGQVAFAQRGLAALA